MAVCAAACDSCATRSFAAAAAARMMAPSRQQRAMGISHSAEEYRIMAIADEITEVIKRRITQFDGASAETSLVSVGTVIEVGDGIARAYGLSGVRYLELVEFPRSGVMGMAFNLEEETVAITVLGDYTQIHEDDEVRTTGRIIQVPVGDALLGRVVNPLGEPIDDAGPINTTTFRPIERVAPGVITRKSVTVPVQ